VNRRSAPASLLEASILGELDHPNIVAFREMGESGGNLHSAMDYMDRSDASRLRKWSS
jgi:serine/threonine protein kinase